MITREEGKNIAGRVFANSFDRQFLVSNVKNMCTTESLQDDMLQVNFCMFKNNNSAVSMHNGIHVEEKNFPETMMSVLVNLSNATASIL